jgi:glycosyltransferase involved in cell wall biosynthesis
VKSIAIFDYRVSPTNPIGGCHRRMLAALSSEYDFTVFAVEFDNPAPSRIAFQRVPVPRRPQALLFAAYHLMAPICYLLQRLRRGKPFDLVQLVEGNLCFGTISYTQFCHRAYLRLPIVALGPANLHRWLRWLDHRLHAAFEPWIYKRVHHIIVPSQGTAAELAREYPEVRGKIRVIYNPVDIERMRRPSAFDCERMRRELGWTRDDIFLVFAALGHFERKGLPILLDALAQVEQPTLKLLVVGGEAGLVKEYQDQAHRKGLKSQIVFTGHRQDIRPYLWSADAFVFPSYYEGFPLVVLEAAAAGLPLIAPSLHGVEELLRDEENGLLVTQTPESVADALRRLVKLARPTLQAMGARAAEDVQRYAVDLYAPRWREFYNNSTKNIHGSMA